MRVPGALGIRAIAAVSILVYHSWLYSSPTGPVDLPEPLQTIVQNANIGTTLFVSLSAFLLFVPLAGAILAKEPLPPIHHFLGRRFLRILPAYWVVLLTVSLLLGAALYRTQDGHLALGSLAGRPAVLAADLLLVQNFWPETLLTGIGPAWFLTSLVGFYLALPFLARLAESVAARGRSPRQRLLALFVPALVLLVLGWGSKVVAVFVVPPESGASPGWDADWHSVLVRSFLVQSDRFAFGTAAAAAWIGVRFGAIQLPRGWWVVALGALVLSGPGAILVHRAELIGRFSLDASLALSISLFFLLVALQGDLPSAGHRLMRLLDSRVLAGIGLISYSVFLWHEPLIRRLAADGLTLAGPVGLVANTVLVAALAASASVVTYYFAERPFISRRPKLLHARAP